MADEKNILDKNEEVNNDSVAENEPVLNTNISSRNEGADFGFDDFSSAFIVEDDDDEDEQEEPEMPLNTITNLFKKEKKVKEPKAPKDNKRKDLPFFKKKKDEELESSVTDKTEEVITTEEKVEEPAQPKEEKIAKPFLSREDSSEESILQAEETEDKVEEEPKPAKENKFKSLMSTMKKKVKQPESAVEENLDEAESAAEKAAFPTADLAEEPIIEPIFLIEETEKEPVEDLIIFLEELDEEIVEEPIVLMEDFDEEKTVLQEKQSEEIIVPKKEITEELPLVEDKTETIKVEKENKPKGFAFFKKDTKFVAKEQSEETILQEEQSVEETPPIEEFNATEENSIELLPAYEEVAEEISVPETKVEEVILPIAAAETKKAKKLKEKKVKEPKPPKEKKVKEPKQKKEKKVKESEVKQNDTSSVELMTKKDHITFILAIFALILTIAFICVKFFPMGNDNPESPDSVVETGEKLSNIQIQREGTSGQLIQSDIDNLFYTYSSVYELSFYQYSGNKMNLVQPNGTVNASVKMGNETISATIDYVQMNGQLFGTGLFRAEDNPGGYLYNTVVFKLVDLPKGYEADGKALLLATANSEAVSKSCNIWTDSFVIELETGKTSRFLSSDNAVYSTGYSILTNEGYASSNGRIPFFTAREYDANSGKKDIFVKIDSKESLYAADVYGSYIYADGDVAYYLKATETGFNVVKKENGKESVVFSLYNSTSYLYHNEYLLDEYNGIIYNVKTGEEKAVAGYKMMNAEMMTVSPDGRYLVVLGMVNSVIDYQVHIFDLQTGDCAKYEEKNFSQHANLAFVDNTSVIYTAVDPNQGYEYVMLDISKAF